MPRTKSNGELKIEKGIPIPRGNYGKARTRPRLSDMKAGDSIFFPGATHVNLSAVRMESRANQIPITTRAVTENGVAGIRVWRIA